MSQPWLENNLWYTQKPFLVADGAIGTGLFARGLMSGDSPELWNVDHQEKVLDLHLEFVNAGSDILLTNSFGGNAARLKLHSLDARVSELCIAAAKLARQASNQSKHECRVAGSMGPTGEILEPDGPCTKEQAHEVFVEQANALAEGGVDALWIETMSSLSELDVAIHAACTTGLPIFVTMTFDTNSHTMMGVSPAQAGVYLTELSEKLTDVNFLGIGANCGLGPAETLAACARMHQANPKNIPMLTKSNCGIPQYQNGQFTFSGTPELMHQYACLAMDLDIKIIGGCCGSDGKIIQQIRNAVDQHIPASSHPSFEKIAQELGPIATMASKAESSSSQHRSRRRRPTK